MAEETSRTQERNPLIIGGVVAVIIVLIAVGAVAINGQSSDTAVEAAPSSQVVSTSPALEVTGAADSKTFEIEGQYVSPGGPETFGLTLTLDGETVIDSVVKVHAENPISNRKQTDFSAAHRELVIGKNINEITLDKVAGASLTSKGYNEALEKLKAQINS